MSNFRITDGKGFRITFENGWAISVQFGPRNYCDHYSERQLNDAEAGATGSRTAECAVFSPEGDFVNLPDPHGYDVAGYLQPAQILELMNWAAGQPASARGES